jgi:hypothetical protein
VEVHLVVAVLQHNLGAQGLRLLNKDLQTKGESGAGGERRLTDYERKESGQSQKNKRNSQAELLVGTTGLLQLQSSSAMI